jgi:hypothetical protein
MKEAANWGGLLPKVHRQPKNSSHRPEGEDHPVAVFVGHAAPKNKLGHY